VEHSTAGQNNTWFVYQLSLRASLAWSPSTRDWRMYVLWRKCISYCSH